MLIVVGCTLIFCVWFWYERNKVARKVNQNTTEFWKREEQANRTRKKDISNLPYVHVSPTQIPNVENASESIIESRNQVLELLDNTMLDLSDYTNTDLKISFGVANFTNLSAYDNNYTNLLTALSTFARHLTEEKYFDAAKSVYQLSIEIGSKKSTDYCELAETYLALDEPGQLSSLIDSVSKNNDLPRQKLILQKLREKLVSYS